MAAMEITFVRLCLQYLVDCDDVILMREGSIVEQGNHDNLIKLNKDYAAMFNHFQLGDTPYIEVTVRLSACLSLSCLTTCLSVSLSCLTTCLSVSASQQEEWRFSEETSRQ